MRTRRSASVAGLAVALLLVGGACSKSDSNSTTSTGTSAPSGTTPGSTAKAKDLSSQMKDVKLVTAGQLTVCSDIPYAPFEFYDKDNGDKLTGFDVQLVESMATSLGVKAEFKVTPFDSIIQSLAAGNCDMIASATTITPEREEKVSFSEPYFDADQSLLVLKADEGTYKKLEDLKGKVIGVQAGTTGADYATENKPEGATVKEFQGADEMFAAVASGDVQALLQDFPVNKYRAVKNPDKFVVTETFKTGEQYGFATNKDATALTTALDSALAEAESNGTYDAIYEAWFGKKGS